MALFVLNTGVRDDVVCNLQWDWEIPVPERGISVFETPVTHVKGQRASKLVVCNSVAQAVVERARGRHTLGPVQTMNNTAWQAARSRVGLPDLHIHDLRAHGRRAVAGTGIADSSRSDVLWHSKRSITDHYSMAQIMEIHNALEKIRQPSNGWNRACRL